MFRSRSKYYNTFCLIILTLISYNILSIVSLLGKNSEIMSVKLLKISPYQFSEIDKAHQEYFDYISKHTRTNTRSIARLLDLTKDKVTYEQTYKDYPIMNNSKARLTFNLSDGKATSYKQTAMDDIQVAKGSNSTKKQVITPRKAIEALYYNRYLKQNDQVLDARLGYYSVVKETNVQLLQPNWEIKVKHKGKDQVHTYYVEATNHNPKVIDY